MSGRAAHAAWRLALPVLCALMAARQDAPPAPGPLPDGPRMVVDARRIPLDPARWTPVGEASQTFDEPSEGRLVFAGMGARWSLVFEVGRVGTARLLLDWSPGPDGQLLELLLDGQRLGPPRDGWRPSERRVVADLGSRWLGPGEHLLEVVAREQRLGRVALHALIVRPPALSRPDPRAAAPSDASDTAQGGADAQGEPESRDDGR